MSPPSLTQAPRILTLDIETAPHLVHSFDLWNTNITKDKMVQPSYMLSFAAKWHGSPEIYYADVQHDGREAMVQLAHDLVDACDWLITYNGRRFDEPYLRKEWMLAGLPPPSPWKSIDLYRTIKSQFDMAYNSLAWACQQLGLDAKGEHEGFGLWIKCMAGDEDAWTKMAEYNKQDVVITEQLYDRLLPWIPGHPSMAAFLGKDVCPSCGGDSLVRWGTAITATGRFQRLKCSACGRYSRATRREAGTQVTAIAA